jgi:hypothetical protein
MISHTPQLVMVLDHRSSEEVNGRRTQKSQ